MPDRIALVQAGDRRALAALMRDLDDDRPHAHDDVRALAAAAGTTPFVVGLTGAPGAGKSTLVDALVGQWRARGERVGVLAIDPSSPVHGGAVLGDRVRMQRHATDDGVFIRSLASRGAAGGLSRSTIEITTALAAGGFSSILIETVGVGQAEVDVAAAADVTVLATVPGLGDSVQTLKAGILEIADILVVNKADLPGAAAAVHDLEAMLELRRASSARHGQSGSPQPQVQVVVPIVQTVATSGQGIADLVAAIDRVRADLGGAAGVTGAPGAAGMARRRQKAEARIRGVVVGRFEAAAREALRPGGVAASLADDVAALRLDAAAAADALMTRLRGPY